MTKVASRNAFRPGTSGRHGIVAVALALCFAAGLLGGHPELALAQDGMERTELKRADLTGADGMEVVQAILVVQPGTPIPRHIHHGDEISYVLEGATLELPDGKAIDLKTGTSIHFPRDTPHGGFKVVGDAPLKLLTVHVVDKGKPFSEASD
jgi:quercetin dioxygenase-like cupin family protein